MKLPCRLAVALITALCLVAPWSGLAEVAAASPTYNYDGAGNVVGSMQLGAAAATTSIANARIDATLGGRETTRAQRTSTSSIAPRRAAKAGEEGLTWAEKSGILRDAAAGKGNYGLGSATSSEADALGRDWVGEGYTVASDGKTLVSSDGLRQYRPPSFKPNMGRTQANFERKFEGQRSRGWQGNGHLDITDLP